MSSVFGKFFGGGGAKNQTFVPSSAKLMGMIVNKQNAMHNQSSDTLGSGDMRAQVVLPDGEDKNEWLAINTIDCFNDICMLYNQVKDACTNESCPVMKAGSVAEYHWADGVKVKKPVKVPAREYVVLMTEWVEETLNDESIFPQDVNGSFPKDFTERVKTIFKRLFRVYAHIYHHHIDSIRQIDAERHVNTCFKHFIYFVREFDLIESKEMTPLQDLINEFVAKDEQRQQEQKQD